MKYVIDHDLHIHSQLSLCSGHPEQTTARILKYAKEMGFKKICLTDHFWDDRVDGASDWYKAQNFAHISKALPLPKEEGITFGFGCETDFDRYMTLGITPETMEKLDFIIVPTNHLHMKGFTIAADVTGVKARARLFMERNHALLDMKLPFEKIGLAHFTCSLIASGCEGSHEDIFGAIPDSSFAELFERIAAVGMGLELNLPLPDCSSEAILRPYRIAKACGCKFYLGSDAHGPEALMGARARFEAITESLGLTEDDKFPLVLN